MTGDGPFRGVAGVPKLLGPYQSNRAFTSGRLAFMRGNRRGASLSLAQWPRFQFAAGSGVFF